MTETPRLLTFALAFALVSTAVQAAPKEAVIDLAGDWQFALDRDDRGVAQGWTSGALPDRIHLYRQAILVEWVETGVRLDDLVRHVTIHEIGHHFGLSDDDMHALEDAVVD